MVRKIYYWLRGLFAYTKLSRIDCEKGLSKCTYRYLWEVSFFSKKSFLHLKDNIVNGNTVRIKGQQKCKIGFVVHSVSMWTIDGLYQLMKSSKFYDPYVIIVPYATSEINKETLDYFVDKGYNVHTLADDEFDLDSFDIILYTHPYVADEQNINILSIPLNKLIIYVSYSYILSNKIEKLDMPVYLLSWMFYCDSPFYKQLVETKSRVYSGNAQFCGYPKMDAYYKLTKENDHSMSEDKKIIIYAPHQSVNYSGVKSATFEYNGWYLLYLAEKYKDRITWIVKPHPLLRVHSVEAGLFKEVQDYDDYLNRWKETGTALVVENGDYMEAFRDSSAMITDSISFLAEYQFTGKPLLLLESGKQIYNEFGDNIRDILYHCKGNDYPSIEKFIGDVIEGNDPMKDRRYAFFKDNLSSAEGDGVFACDNMYTIINSELTD